MSVNAAHRAVRQVCCRVQSNRRDRMAVAEHLFQEFDVPSLHATRAGIFIDEPRELCEGEITEEQKKCQTVCCRKYAGTAGK